MKLNMKYQGQNRDYIVSLFFKFGLFAITIISTYVIIQLVDIYIARLPLLIEWLYIPFFVILIFYLFKQFYLLMQAVNSKLLFVLKDNDLLIYKPYSKNMTLEDLSSVTEVSLISRMKTLQQFKGFTIWFPTFQNSLILYFENKEPLKIPIYSSPKFAEDAGKWLATNLNVNFSIDSDYQKLARWF